MDKIKVLAVVDEENLRYDLKNKLTADDIAFAGFAKTDAALEKAQSLAPNVVLIVSDGGRAHTELAEKIYVAIPGCSVILLCGRVDIAAMEQAMRAGIRKVLPLDCAAQQLSDGIRQGFMLERARIRNYGGELSVRRSKLIAVFGAKGGIGKTTIAANLAVSLAQAGKKVFVLDLDLQFGDINLFFDIEPRDTIAELVSGSAGFDIDTIRSYVRLHSTGVSILCAPKSPEYAETVRGEHVEKILNTIRPFYDYVVIDTPPVFNDTTIQALENSDRILLPVTLDISTLRNAKISMDILESLQQKEKVSVLVSRNAPSLITVRDAQGILDYPIQYRISNDWKTATTALNKGIPIVIDAPRTAIAHELRELARLVISGMEAE